MGDISDQQKDVSMNLVSYLRWCGLANTGNDICKDIATWATTCVNRQHMNALGASA